MANSIGSLLFMSADEIVGSGTSSRADLYSTASGSGSSIFYGTPNPDDFRAPAESFKNATIVDFQLGDQITVVGEALHTAYKHWVSRSVVDYISASLTPYGEYTKLHVILFDQGGGPGLNGDILLKGHIDGEIVFGVSGDVRDPDYSDPWYTYYTFQNFYSIKIIDDVSPRNLQGSSYGNDTLRGGKGNDTLDGKAGADTLIGGAGNDTYYVDNTQDVIIEKIGEGNDRVVSTVSYTLSDNVESLQLIANADTSGIGNALDNYISGNSGDNDISGQGGADILTGGNGNDRILGGSGDDNIEGGDGIDDLYGGEGDDLIVDSGTNDYMNFIQGEEGNDTIVVSSGIVSIDGGDGNDNIILLGSAVGEELRGGLGDDIISGGSKGDEIYGGDGADTLTGGSGIDFFYGYDGDLKGDLITDYQYGEQIRLLNSEPPSSRMGDYDLVYTGDTAEIVVRYFGYENPVGIISLKGDIEGGLFLTDYYGYRHSNDNVLSIVASGAAATFKDDLLAGTAQADKIDGLSGDDQIRGLAGADDLKGGAGDDEISGGTGDDTIDGGAGRDFLYGDTGNDTIMDSGADNAETEMYGGAGNDTYHVNDDGEFVIEFTNKGTDRVISTISYTLTDNVENLQLVSKGNSDAIGNSLANYIGGNSGNNLIDGRGGADKMYGGGGADTFVFHAGEANGDLVGDFTGANATGGDILLFVGYGTGASLMQVGSTDSYVVKNADSSISETIKIAGIFDLATNSNFDDVLFV